MNKLVESIKKKDFKTVKEIVEKELLEIGYDSLVKELYSKLYEAIEPTSLSVLIIEFGDNANQLKNGTVGNLKAHVNLLVVRLMLNLKWKNPLSQ